LRRRFLVIVTCFLISSNISFGQKGLSAEQGALSTSLGGIKAVLSGSDAVLNNFSLITDQTDLGIILSSSRRFNISELSTVALGVHLPVSKFGHFGVELYSFGFDAYSEQLVSLKYARKLMKNFSVSTSFGLQSVQVEGSGSAHKLAFSLGMSGNLYDNLSWGVFVSNPERQSLNENTDLVTSLAFGLSYEVSEKVSFYSEVEKQLEEDIAFRTGLDYSIFRNFNLRFGYNTLPGQINLGFSLLILDSISFESAIAYDSLLGITPVVSFNYLKLQIDKKKRFRR